MRMVQIVVAWGFPLVVICYLYCLLTVVYRMKKEQASFWASIGNPSNMDPIGQMKILGLILRPGALPQPLFDVYRSRIYGVRIFGALGLIFFAAIFGIVWTTGFQRFF